MQQISQVEILLGDQIQNMLAWFAGIQQRKRRIGTDLDKEFDGGSGETVLQEFDDGSGD